jgi:hypothetical protein
LADEGPQRTVDHVDVVLGDHDRGDRRCAPLAVIVALLVGVATLGPEQDGQRARPLGPFGDDRVVEQPGVVVLALVVGVGFAVLLEASLAVGGGEAPEVLDADAREQPSLPRDAARHRHEVEAL